MAWLGRLDGQDLRPDRPMQIECDAIFACLTQFLFVYDILTSFLIKRLEIDYMPSCTHFYPSRMDWTDGTVPYDGFSFSYDGVSFFCVFFFYFSYITLHYTYLCHIYSKLDIICGLLYITHAML